MDPESVRARFFPHTQMPLHLATGRHRMFTPTSRCPARPAPTPCRRVPALQRYAMQPRKARLQARPIFRTEVEDAPRPRGEKGQPGKLAVALQRVSKLRTWRGNRPQVRQRSKLAVLRDDDDEVPLAVLPSPQARTPLFPLLEAAPRTPSALSSVGARAGRISSNASSPRLGMSRRLGGARRPKR